MDDLQLAWTLPTPALLGIAAAAVAALLVLIIGARVHAFLALVVVSLLTALATGVPPDQVVPVMTSGFGSTLASVALLVGLGAMLGRMLELSGGAEVLTESLVQRFGERRAPVALGVASLLMGFPIFFDAGLVVMLPIVFAVARRLGGSVLVYAFPAVIAFSAMHVFVPPHPGPVAASGLLGADVGLTLVLALFAAVPGWYLVGKVFGGWVGRRYDLPVPEILSGRDDAEQEFASRPSVRTTLGLLALPLVLIFLNTGLNALATAGTVSLDDTWVQILRLLGETPVALLITVFVTMWVLGWSVGRPRALVESVVDGALAPICAIILITGAGGMFGGVLRSSGIGGAVADSLNDLGLPLVVAGWLIAAIVRIAQGSATVALTTGAALIQPAVLADSSLTTVQLSAMVIALAGGSVFAGHVNDSGFWLVSRFLGMDTATTLRTWTVSQALLGVVGFVVGTALFAVGSL
ncbi:GntP family permease [Nocardioides acrostichi]|uniref:GntP family permease n=1 Tax=Nocardioides acrostichi TaxID=2784339 RepID=A0A930YCT9_9ACTN|nr:GntP family permease [Nocardioides acrostichi]MBF4163853.1 GntP family permease [Nocardioides acrostichi]